MKKVTIVFPLDENYQTIDNIRSSLKSFKTLNYKNVDVLIVHNLKTLKNYIDYLDPKWRIIEKDYNNLYQTFNLGINSIINSDYVTFVMPGDILESNYFDILTNISEHIDIIQCQHTCYDSENKRKFTKKPIPFGTYDLSSDIPEINSNLSDKIFNYNLIYDNKIYFSKTNQAKKLFTLAVMCKARWYQILSKNSITIEKSKSLIFNSSFVEANKINSIVSRYETNNQALSVFISKYLEINNKCLLDNNIDFVFPFVTSNDETWQKLYKEHLKGDESAWAAGIERFRDDGFLKYLFRGLAKNLPWINKVHMLVMSESQVPDWVNRENVNIITHDKFIPKEYLPTFNSTTIEMFLPLLEDVSEYFIYSNDDLLPFKELSPNYFFKGVLPSYQLSIRDFNPNAPGDIIRRNCYHLMINDNSENRVVTTQHGTISYKKSWLKECFDKNKNKILNSISDFRSDYNYNQYIYAFYQMFYKEINNSEKDIVSFTIKNNQLKKLLSDDFTKRDFICLNDSNNSTKEQKQLILEKLIKLLPNKCKYEV